jgi:hypothetical protein
MEENAQDITGLDSFILSDADETDSNQDASKDVNCNATMSLYEKSDCLDDMKQGDGRISQSAITTRRASLNSNCAEGLSPKSIYRHKKSKGMPKRPLSAYNLFFQMERPKILALYENSEKRNGQKIGFVTLAKIIGKRWSQLPRCDRRKFDTLAEADSSRYQAEMSQFQAAKQLSRARYFSIDRSLENSTLVKQISETTNGSDISSGPINSLNSIDEDQNEGCPNTPLSSREPLSSSVYTANGYNTYDNEFSFPVPPGMQVMIPDAQGVERRHVVTYNVYRMKQSEAQQYMKQLLHQPHVPSIQTNTYRFTEKKEDWNSDKESVQLPPNWQCETGWRTSHGRFRRSSLPCASVEYNLDIVDSMENSGHL